MIGNKDKIESRRLCIYQPRRPHPHPATECYSKVISDTIKSVGLCVNLSRSSREALEMIKGDEVAVWDARIASCGSGTCIPKDTSPSYMQRQIKPIAILAIFELMTPLDT